MCGCGINHFPRPERAIEEFACVVTPGEGIALSTWTLPERNRLVGILVDALRACGMSRPQEAVAGPDPYRFADDDELGALLCDAGLEDIEVHSVSLSQRDPTRTSSGRGCSAAASAPPGSL